MSFEYALIAGVSLFTTTRIPGSGSVARIYGLLWASSTNSHCVWVCEYSVQLDLIIMRIFKWFFLRL